MSTLQNTWIYFSVVLNIVLVVVLIQYIVIQDTSTPHTYFQQQTAPQEVQLGAGGFVTRIQEAPQSNTLANQPSIKEPLVDNVNYLNALEQCQLSPALVKQVMLVKLNDDYNNLTDS
ncbi:MAG: hypothetical protein V3T17_06570 [Pseudomonadales bacterium]